MSPRLIRAIYAVHKWCGLLIGLNMLILSVTAIYLLAYRASWYVFNDANAAWAPPALLDERRCLPMQPSIDKLGEVLQATGLSIRAVLTGRQEGDIHEFLFADSDGMAASFAMEPYTGALSHLTGKLPGYIKDKLALIGCAPMPPPEAAAAGSQTPTTAAWIAEWMLALHADLFLGELGTLIVGLVGILFLVSIISGFIIYFPFMRAMSFGTLRDGKLRFSLADAHKLIGITALVFNLVIALSGIAITIGILAVEPFVERQVAALAPAVELKQDSLPSIDAVLAAARSARDDWHVFRVDFPSPERHPQHFLVSGEPRPGWQDMVPLYCVVNASSPAMGVPLPRPLWVSAIIVGAPMHYGNFAGMWMRLVYLFLAIGSSALSLSGFAMYAMKARRTRAKGAAQ